MLSLDNWHQGVPKDYLKNLKFRMKLLDLVEREGKAGQEAMLLACKEDFFFWVNVYVWQYNPNSIGDKSKELGPFITWEFQDRAARKILWCIEKRRDLVIEKSREMGASWLCLLIILWLFLFHDWKKFLMMSRNEQSVDRPEDSDSLFWKIDFVLSYLPDWMTEGRVKRRKMGLKNPLTKSSITGQATTGKVGVSGRCTAMFLDEFSMVNEDFEILQRTSDTTGCRIFNGTHRGVGTAFYQLTDPSSIVGSFIERLRMHWTEHPDKAHGLYQYQETPTPHVEIFDKDYEFPEGYKFVMDGKVRSPWYDDQCKRKPSARAIAEDLDIDPKGSVSQYFDPLLISHLKAQYGQDPIWEGDVVYDPDTATFKAFVPRRGGPLKLWIKLDINDRPPQEGYGFGADISAGTGATPSCLAGTNKKTGKKVLEYTNAFIDPEDFAAVCVCLCKVFADKEDLGAALGWEKQGPGVQFGKRVIELGYRNVLRNVREDKLTKQFTESIGWYPSPDNKRALLDAYYAALKNRLMINPSRDALDECLLFKFDERGKVVHGTEDSPNDPAGARVNHADHVIADAISWKMVGGKILREQAKAIEQNPVAGTLAWRRQVRADKMRELQAW